MVVAEILLVLAGHSSSIFIKNENGSQPPKISPAFAELLHPGEIESLQSLARIAWRYSRIKNAKRTLCTPNNAGHVSKYLSALYATLNDLLKTEYEALVIETEARVVKRDDAFVASGSFVPLSSIRATFAEWDAPFASIQALLDRLAVSADGTSPPRGEPPQWPPGRLIDMLLERANSGIARVASVMSRLAVAVQRVWRIELTAFLVHGTLSTIDPLVNEKEAYSLHADAIPSCVSFQTRESITYVGKAVLTVRSAPGQKQLPRELALRHTKLLEQALPQDRYAFDKVITEIRTNVSEWLWSNVLTKHMVNEALDSLGNYFLLRNGEFGLSLIREIERLKISRLTARNTTRSGIIREQDLQLAMLRASLGTSAQHDLTLTRLKMTLPSGPSRPLLPSLSNPNVSAMRPTQVNFSDVLLGTPLVLLYNLQWPLDLFLRPADLQVYADLFSYISSIRKVQTRVLECWGWLSNAQRARRKWTGLGEGGTEDSESRRVLLRCGWGVVRDMLWFLDTLLAYIMTDVIDVEFRKMKSHLHLSPTPNTKPSRTRKNSGVNFDEPLSSHPLSTRALTEQPTLSTSQPTDLDFTTLRDVHNRFLECLLTASLLANPLCASTIRTILEVCERFVAQVERWGGDVLPALLFEGSVSFDGGEDIGKMVRERWKVVHDVNEVRSRDIRPSLHTYAISL
jgi:gamma-tubulin complex component 4